MKKVLKITLAAVSACGIVAFAVFMYRVFTRVTVSFDLGAREAVTNESDFKAVKVFKGKTVTPKTPESDYATFTGWLRYDERTGFYPFDEAEKLKEDIILYADWSLGDTDTDKDGLPDDFENKIGTNPYMADTDGDGVSDYIELFAGTDPLKIGYDSNGIGDYEKCKTGGFIPFDFELDSDNDGASDEWEKAHGFNPFVKNASFEVSEQCEVPGEAVSVEVYAALSGKQAETLSVKPVFPYESSFISSSIPGYLGCAYEFNVDGDFSEALINFKFDKSVEGYGKKGFQPRIYYINEKTGFLEELPDQEVYGNGVYATVKHFSKYILLDKTKFDAIWTKDIANPEIGKIGGSIIFAVDNSASMSDNDPGMIRYDVVSKFVQGLDDSSRAGLLYYERQSHVLSELTKDYLGFGDKLKAVSVDAGNNIYYSGSSPVNALRTSMSMFTGTDTGKIIVLLSDGKESGGHDEKTIEKMKEELIVMGIRVFCFGFGEDDSEFLTALSEATGGRYYHISSSGDILTADEYLDSLKPKAIDLLEDANGDHLPDYYAQLLFQGLLPLKNGSLEMKNYFFNGDKDIDGDGILNGDEIKIIFDAVHGVVATLLSDPRYADTDCDGYSDSEEKEMKTDPFEENYFLDASLAPYEDDYCFYYETILKNWKSNFLYRDSVAILQFFSGTRPSIATYADALSDYLVSFGQDLESYDSKKDLNAENREMIMAMRAGIEKYSNALTMSDVNAILLDSTQLLPYEVYENSEGGKQVLEGMLVINDVVKEGKLSDQRLVNVIERSLDGTDNGPIIHVKVAKQHSTEINEAIGSIGEIMDAKDIVCDVVDRLLLVQKVANGCEFYYNQMDFIKAVIELSQDECLKAAARIILDSMSNQSAAAIKLMKEELVNVLIDKGISLVEDHAQWAGVLLKVTKFVMFTSLGTEADMEQLNMLSFYSEIYDAASFVFYSNAVRYPGGYSMRLDGSRTVINQAINHMLRIRILGEGAYYDYQKGEGLFNSNREMYGIEGAKENISLCWQSLNNLGYKSVKSELMNSVFEKYQIK